MAFFRQCHKEIGARSIGESIKETILNLRKQLEERCEAPLVHPFTNKPLTKHESTYIEQIRKEKGFQTVREAFAYFEGRLEGRIEKQLSKALEQEEEQQPTSSCIFYSRKGDWIFCRKDEKHKEEKKRIIHKVTQEICDLCWTQIQSKKQQAEEDQSESHTTTINIKTS
jgi:hypothetical protein